MKKLFILTGLLTLVASCVSQKPNNNEMNAERLTYFSFDHHNSMVLFYGEKYNVSTMKDGRIHVVIDEGFPGEKEFYLDDSTIFDELLAIVKAYKMDKYKDSYQPNMRVFDGDSWNLYYKYDSGRSVSSGGYMAWPSNYREARQAISDYFKKWREYQDGVMLIEYFKFTCKNNQGRDEEYILEHGETEATLILRNAEKGLNSTLKVSNDYLQELQQTTNVALLKNELYDYHSSDENATRCDYFVRYNTGDTISGYTCFTQYVGHKEGAIMNFFSRWVEAKEPQGE